MDQSNSTNWNNSASQSSQYSLREQYCKSEEASCPENYRPNPGVLVGHNILEYSGKYVHLSVDSVLRGHGEEEISTIYDSDGENIEAAGLIQLGEYLGGASGSPQKFQCNSNCIL